MTLQLRRKRLITAKKSQEAQRITDRVAAWWSGDARNGRRSRWWAAAASVCSAAILTTSITWAEAPSNSPYWQERNPAPWNATADPQYGMRPARQLHWQSPQRPVGPKADKPTPEAEQTDAIVSRSAPAKSLQASTDSSAIQQVSHASALTSPQKEGAETFPLRRVERPHFIPIRPIATESAHDVLGPPRSSGNPSANGVQSAFDDPFGDLAPRTARFVRDGKPVVSVPARRRRSAKAPTSETIVIGHAELDWQSPGPGAFADPFGDRRTTPATQSNVDAPAVVDRGSSRPRTVLPVSAVRGLEMTSDTDVRPATLNLATAHGEDLLNSPVAPAQALGQPDSDINFQDLFRPRSPETAPQNNGATDTPNEFPAEEPATDEPGLLDDQPLPELPQLDGEEVDPNDLFGDLPAEDSTFGDEPGMDGPSAFDTTPGSVEPGVEPDNMTEQPEAPDFRDLLPSTPESSDPFQDDSELEPVVPDDTVTPSEDDAFSTEPEQPMEDAFPNDLTTPRDDVVTPRDDSGFDLPDTDDGMADDQIPDFDLERDDDEPVDDDLGLDDLDLDDDSTSSPTEDKPKSKADCDRIYNERNCCNSESDCRSALQKLRDSSINTISLDISPPMLPGEEDLEAATKKRAETLGKVPSRAFTNRSGNVVATGWLHDFTEGTIRVRRDDGTVTSVRYVDLSEDDMCFVNAWWGLPAECRLPDMDPPIRDWTMTTYTWTASALCHKPLYFEHVELERYGHTAGPVLQPLWSGAHFFANAVLLPYNSAIHPANECLYSLGYYRPGSCAPWLIPGFPLSKKAALSQTLSIFGTYGVLH